MKNSSKPSTKNLKCPLGDKKIVILLIMAFLVNLFLNFGGLLFKDHSGHTHIHSHSDGWAKLKNLSRENQN